MLSLIAAVGRNNEIGKENTLPWCVPDEMKLFRHMTSGGIVVMGRRTAESLGKPLKDRINVVLSRSADRVPEGFLIAPDVASVMALAQDHSLWVIGGEQIYRLFMPMATRVYLSHIELDVEGADAFFPIDEMEKCGFRSTLTVRPSTSTDAVPFYQTMYQKVVL